MPDHAALERRATELLQRLVRFDTVNPPGGEEAAQEYLRELLEGAGFACELLAAVPGRPNLVARLPGRADGPVLALLAHVDTVLADPAAWTVDPWSGELRDGCVWGRGALDMKGQLACELAAALELAEAGWRPESGALLLVVTADEEAGATHGARWLCEEHPERVRCDWVVNEGAGARFEYGGRAFYEVCVAEKGVFRFRLSTSGSAGHASIPRIGDNALVKIAPLLERMRAGQPAYDHTAEPAAFFAALGVDHGTDLAAALAEVEGREPRLGVLRSPMLGVTLTPTMAAASRKVNVIPARAEVRVDCRVPPELGEAHVLARVEEVLGAEGYELEWDERVTGNRSAIDTPLMEEIRAWVGEVEPGAALAPIVLPGFTDSRWFRAAFPECTAYGFFPQRAMDLFESQPLIHGADERIPVEDLGLAAGCYAHLARRLLG